MPTESFLQQSEGYAVVPNLQGQLVAFVIDKAKDIASPVDDLY